jgi:hypothetical protein
LASIRNPRLKVVLKGVLVGARTPGVVAALRIVYEVNVWWVGWTDGWITGKDWGHFLTQSERKKWVDKERW